ncbi:MAG TPA: type II CAAX endopeptidase family protein, partial [Bacteroidota bacterium]
WIGLFVAVIVPVLMSTSSLWRNPKSVTPSTLGFVVFSLPLFILVLIVKYGEKEPFGSLGNLTINVKTIGLSLLTLVIMIVATFLFTNLMLTLNIVPGPEPIYSLVRQFPLWGKLLLVVWAGLSEEFYYRGYAITRLQELTRNRYVAAILPLCIFGIGHAVDGSLYHIVFAILIGAVLTVSYLKTRNLIANMISHTLFDFVLIVLLP